MSRLNKKVALIGTGMVGMSYAYALLNQSACDELVLIDVNKEKAVGEAMDLNHGLAFSSSSMKIYAGEYSDCHNASIVVIAAGVAQKPNETRLDLLKRNGQVFKSIIEPVTQSGFNGIFLIATNPVDIMTQITYHLSGFNSQRVIGSGTALDTARLRYLLGEYFSINPRNVHAYVMGEHGDTEFVPWTQTYISSKPVLQICKETDEFCIDEMDNIAVQVRDSAQKIIKAKQATYYGIGMALVRITQAILSNENSVITVSALLRGEYGQSGVYTGVPCIVNQNGIRKVIELDLSKEEKNAFDKSCKVLKDSFTELNLP